MTEGSMARQLAAIKRCDAGLEQVASLLPDLLSQRESATGAARIGEMLDTIRCRLVDEFPALAAEKALEVLVEADGWEHPAPVIGRASCDWVLLLRVCEERLAEASGGERARLEEVRRKLVRALRIDEGAREQRRKLREKKAEMARRRRRRRQRGSR